MKDNTRITSAHCNPRKVTKLKKAKKKKHIKCESVKDHMGSANTLGYLPIASSLMEETVPLLDGCP